MLNFLLDIAPDKSQLLLTIKLAGILAHPINLGD